MIKNKLKIGLVFALVMMFGAAISADAAVVNTYSADTVVDLSTADFTIKSNSTDGGLEVNADTLVVTTPAAAGTFAVTCATGGISYSGTVDGVTFTQTCNSSLLDTVVITFAAGSSEGDITLTPSSTQCTYTGSSSSSSGGGTTPSTPSSTTGEVNATYSRGGSVSKTNEDGTKAKVVLPSRAVSSTTTVTVAPTAKATATASRPVPTGSSIVGDYAYNFTAARGTTAVTSFNKALTVTLTYTNAQAAGLSEGTLKIHYWDDTTSAWVALEDSAVNTATNTVTATTTHFTYFAILGTAAEEGEEEDEGGTTPSTEVIDGDIVQCASSSNPFAVYIVKVVGDTKYIRHIVSLEIFDYYGHLEWENLKPVDSLDSYSLSGWARVNTGPDGTPGPNDKVYEINGDQSKHWINMTAEDFLAHGGSDPAIYTVNQGELDLYTTGPDVMSL